jgi:hypothetical protein
MEQISELELAKLQIAEMEKEIHYLRMRVKALTEIDPDERPWTYDGNGQKVHKNDYTKRWIEEKPSVIGDGSYGHLDI